MGKDGLHPGSKADKTGESKPKRKDIHDAFYAYNANHSAVDQWQETTEIVIEHVCSTFKESQLIKACITNLKLESIPEPRLEKNGFQLDEDGKPTTIRIATREDEMKFSMRYKQWQSRQADLTDGLHKTFAIVYTRCTRAMKAKLQEHADWKDINSKCDVIDLLKIIKGVAHKNESQRNPTMALIEAEKRLMNMVQNENQSNDSYHLKFENQANVIENMGGQLYRNATLTIVSKDLYSEEYSKLDSSQQAAARKAATELWKASLFIANSNPVKFDQLKKELHNDYIRGDKQSYPSTFTDAYNRLNQHKTFASAASSNLQDRNETAFTQTKKTTSKQKLHSKDSSCSESDDEIKPAPSRYSDWVCSVCGKTGHTPTSSYCPMVRALKNNPTIQKQLKEAAVKGNSGNSDSDQSSKKEKSSTKKTSKQSSKKKEKKKEIIQEMAEALFATINRSSSSRSDDSASSADASNDSPILQFFQREARSAPTSRSSRSAGKHRSDKQEPDVWTLVPSKKHHTGTIGDTITVQNSRTGLTRRFTSTNSFSSLDDGSDDSESTESTENAIQY